MILNQWDVQSKHIHTPEGIASSLYAGECRYGGGEMYVLVARKEVYEDIDTGFGSTQFFNNRKCFNDYFGWEDRSK